MLIDTATAAAAVKRQPQTIRVWASAGLITRRGTDARRRALYDLDEVLGVSHAGAKGVRALRALGSTPVSSATRVPGDR